MAFIHSTDNAWSFSCSVPVSWKRDGLLSLNSLSCVLSARRRLYFSLWVRRRVSQQTWFFLFFISWRHFTFFGKIFGIPNGTNLFWGWRFRIQFKLFFFLFRLIRWECNCQCLNLKDLSLSFLRHVSVADSLLLGNYAIPERDYL
jgi:hypothetical protein